MTNVSVWHAINICAVCDEISIVTRHSIDTQIMLMKVLCTNREIVNLDFERSNCKSPQASITSL